MKKGIIFLIIFLGIFVFALAYIGVFTKIEIKEAYFDEIPLVFKKHTGDYKYSTTVIDDVRAGVKDYVSDNLIGFGLYYDNPNVVNVNKDTLSSEIGLILDEDSYDRLKTLYYEESDTLDDSLEVGIETGKDSIIIEFPYVGEFSIGLARFKIYPKITEYLQLKGYVRQPLLEIYDIDNKKIKFIMQVSTKEREW